jgi:hypothetical protein
MRRATVSTALVLALLTLSAAARTSDPASAAEDGSVASAQPFFVNGAVDAHLASPAQPYPRTRISKAVTGFFREIFLPRW